jgi:hypothetical protein
VLPVAAVARIAVTAGPVLRQVDQHGVAVRRLAPAQSPRFAHPDQVREREADLRRDPVLERGVVTGDVQMPAPAAAVVGQPGPGA